MTVNAERMIVTNAGNVGIGTSTPSQKLDVAGSVNVAGNLALPATASASVGVITLGAVPFVHNFGSNNTFLGSNAGNFTMTGTDNTASGFEALFVNTTGVGNTANGVQALFRNTTGSYNAASGVSALVNNTTGSSNIGIGTTAGQNLTTGNNNIDIGNVGFSAEASTIRIGSNQARAFIAGIRAVTTGAADAIAVLIDSNGQLGTVSSSRRSKFDIAGMGDATDGLMRLRPVTFRYRAHGDHAPLQYGLIAEEVAEVYPELVARNRNGDVETVMYQFLAPMLLNEVQKQHLRIEEQQAENAALRDQLASLLRRVEQLEVKRTATQ
jgi:hypothetical protein